MADDLRSKVMTPGHCTFCGGPAERGLSGAWWHIGQFSHPMYGVVRGGEVPAGPLGLAAQWPPRFKAGPYEGPWPEHPDPCCDLHNTHCEPPSELCCHACPEVHHPQHPPGTRCVLDRPEET